MTVSNSNRRSFLATSGFAVAGVASLRSRPAWGAPLAATPRLQLGIQLYSLREFPVAQALEHAAKIGFSQVEFYSGMLPTNASAETLDETRKAVADLGMTISSHGVNHVGSDRKANEKLFEFGKALGVKSITIDPDPDSFDQLDELVKAFDMRVAIHNHGPHHRYNKAVDVLRAVEKHDERIGACADLGHYIRSGEKPTEVIRLLRGRLYGIHLKDFSAMEDKANGVILGQGHLNVDAVMDALVAVDFPADGALSLEYEENPHNPITDIKACFMAAESAVERVNKAAS
ncbi:MAG: sugar phosphate isomerase/epimerase [Planctomycetales bacterium]|nr:sugar phosphate isomerase/epimerase [Planctomycetales bacterium]